MWSYSLHSLKLEATLRYGTAESKGDGLWTVNRDGLWTFAEHICNVLENRLRRNELKAFADEEKPPKESKDRASTL